jgi:hypothetical protein
VLNQNYFAGWKAVVRGADRARAIPASANSAGLVSVEVRPGDAAVEFYYLPKSFLWGAAISAATLIGCAAPWIVQSRKRGKTAQPPGAPA